MQRIEVKSEKGRGKVYSANPVNASIRKFELDLQFHASRDGLLEFQKNN